MTDGSLGLRASLGLALSPRMCSLLGAVTGPPKFRAKRAVLPLVQYVPPMTRSEPSSASALREMEMPSAGGQESCC